MINLIVIGKYRKKEFAILEENYQKRFKSKYQVHELKANAESPEKESALVEQRIEKLSIKDFYLLDENGKTYNSRQLSDVIFNDSLGHFTLIIGGAHGHHDNLRKKAKGLISLSPLTLPHQLARLLTVEQLYRAECIYRNHPYHHD